MPRHVELTSAGTFCCAVAPMLDRLDASVRQIRVGASRPRGLRKPDDLARHTLLEEDDHRPSAESLSWRPGLRQPAPAVTEPQGWICLNFTYQPPGGDGRPERGAGAFVAGARVSGAG